MKLQTEQSKRIVEGGPDDRMQSMNNAEDPSKWALSMRA